MSLRLTVAAITGDFKQTFTEMYGPIEQAAQAAIVSTAVTVKSEGRTSIRAAGFSARWQNALRVDVYPRTGASVNAAAFIYHKIGYAGIFEEGGTISGKPMLWLPLRTTPKKIGTRRMTPKNFVSEIGPLTKIAGSRPLLGAPMAVNGPADKEVSLNKLRQGAGKSTFRAGEKRRRLAGGKVAKDGFGKRTIPLFVGKPQVRIPDKFSIREICEAASARLAELYYANFKDD